MKEKIIALLVASFQGVRKDGLNQLARTLALQATTDDEAKALVEKLTKEQVDSFIKDWRAEVDKEVSESNKTFEANLRKKYDLVEKGGGTEPGGNEPTNEPNPNDIAALIKAAIAPLHDEIKQFKAGDVAKSRLQTLSEKLNGCRDETFKAKALKDFARMRFETDEDFNEYLIDTETDIVAANQNVANTALGGGSNPWRNSAPNGKQEATKEEIDAVIEQLPI